MSRTKRPLPAASLARIEEEHRSLAQWLMHQDSPGPRAALSWVDGLSTFAVEARRHRELEEELIRHYGLSGLRTHRDAHRDVEAEIERVILEARRQGDQGGPLLACELVASWLGHHQTAWDQIRPKD